MVLEQSGQGGLMVPRACEECHACVHIAGDFLVPLCIIGRSGSGIGGRQLVTKGARPGSRGPGHSRSPEWRGGPGDVGLGLQRSSGLAISSAGVLATVASASLVSAQERHLLPAPGRPPPRGRRASGRRVSGLPAPRSHRLGGSGPAGVLSCGAGLMAGVPVLSPSTVACIFVVGPTGRCARLRWQHRRPSGPPRSLLSASFPTLRK
mmetsp:Transcript_55495/g.121545  ORF Transcript_55495/g.121545 Transcript_55495/m.121545 type:complete len:207 (+) Transcript_55495:910-1530(+)